MKVKQDREGKSFQATDQHVELVVLEGRDVDRQIGGKIAKIIMCYFYTSYDIKYRCNFIENVNNLQIFIKSYHNSRSWI